MTQVFSSVVRAAAFASAVFLAPAAFAQGAGDVAAGKKVTDFLCRNCHDVSGSERPKSPPGGAPSFFEVAQSPETTAASLHKFLHIPHGRMINVLLTGREVDDAIAYIMSFKRK
jgi:cytochrome c2